MIDSTRQAILDLFLSAQADNLDNAGAFTNLVNNFNVVNQTLNKMRFLNNIEKTLSDNNLSSVSIDYSYETDDEGGSYISYSVSDAQLADGSDYDENEQDLYELTDDIGFDYLSENMCMEIVNSGPISIERIPAITSILIGPEEKEILQYFKIKKEHQALSVATPIGSPKPDNNFKV